MRWLLFLFGVILLVVILGFRLQALTEPTQRSVINELSSLRYPEQIDQAKGLCTQHGFELIQNSTQFGINPDQLTQFKYEGKVKLNGTLCDVPMVQDAADGKTEIYVRLLNDNGWKFQDVLVIAYKNRPAHFFLSWAIDNPIFADLKLHTDDIKQGGEMINDIADFLQKVRSLNAAPSPEPPPLPLHETPYQELSPDPNQLDEQENANLKLFADPNYQQTDSDSDQ